MTTPGNPPLPPQGSYQVGSGFGQKDTQEVATSKMTAGVLGTYEDVQSKIGTNIHTPILTAQGTASVAQAAAGTAYTQAQAAINAAANASNLADMAYANAQFWQLEFAQSSAEVVRGTGEVLVGPMLNVRDDQLAILTDIHARFLEQHGGLTFELRIWNADNTAYRVAYTCVIEPNVTRRHFPALTVGVADLESFWVYVTDIVGTAPPTVLQICCAGVFTPDPEFA
ncbi:hypothetical protein [Nocardia africana]|uniref:Uncharacterized protein n=1 Tax=Nocardia africana TaxID=134964 RepID=A0A378X0S3_9NOCA|nr:hypothetical protein [Nocardia africana]MCC3311542.1 hypothetical protein [Nocardia africana]SUA47196.1 Uncharacterised protein [Nocardia africana]